MATASALVSAFEERAENLSEQELANWTVLSDAERQILRKLTGPGAKLISGPRGSGKSTLLKTAYYQLIQTKGALPLYVNFSRALALEPLFHTNANATAWFRQWVLAKIVVALREGVENFGSALSPSAGQVAAVSAAFIVELETGKPPTQDPSLSPSAVSALVSASAAKVGVNRSVLLLDDAAHAFSVKQQREFFEVFRELRSREIAAKAAIYPGVTSFSPSFQVGHEAEEIQAWIRVDSPTYLATMRQMASQRFPTLSDLLDSNYEESVDVLALASFGMPRGFVNMISEVIDSVELGSPARKAVLDAVSSHSESVVTQFENIADKLPRFANYVKVGSDLERLGRNSIKHFNKEKDYSHKTTTLGLSEPWSAELDRVLRFMEYAGLLRRIENLSKGVKGNYQRYMLHYARVISQNALFLGKNYRIGAIVAALSKPSSHQLVKTKPDTLLGANYSSKCTLALPPCPKCFAARISEDQKFCMTCGQELRSASVYLELLKTPISKLPLPDRKKTALLKSGFATIGQLLSDENQRFRKPGSSIGPVWAKRIINVAEEFVSV